MVEESNASGRAGFTLPLASELANADFHPERWPTYRPRKSVAARRLSEPIALDGRLYRDGYVVRDAAGHLVVMAVADFEAVYELASLHE